MTIRTGCFRFNGLCLKHRSRGTQHGLLRSLGTALMYHVIASFDFLLSNYFFAEMVRTICLEAAMYSILQSDQYTLTIINCRGYKHSLRSPAVPTDSQKIPCFLLNSGPYQYTPTFLNTSHTSHLQIWTKAIIFKNYFRNIWMST